MSLTETKLKALMGEYSKSLRNVIILLDLHASNKAAATGKKAAQERAPRKVKVYKNPHTGETIETKGGNHKGLKEWKAQHGADTVESWFK